MTIAYLNGDYLPLTEARISPMDRGFLFGDGVYEVFPVYGGKIFRLEQHLERLDRSLRNIELPLQKSVAKWFAILNKLVVDNGSGNQSLYLQITRGTYIDRQLAFQAPLQATIFAYSKPLPDLSIDELAVGINTITLEDIRWHACDTKAVTLLANALLRQQAEKQGMQEAILYWDGVALEGTSSNLFIVKDDLLITPPLCSKLLGGITRQLILELAQQHNIAYTERSIQTSELYTADEVWLSGSSREISPVITIDGNKIGGGKAGAKWYQMIQHYREFKQKFIDE